MSVKQLWITRCYQVTSILILHNMASAIALASELSLSDFWLSSDLGIASNLIQEDYQGLADDKDLDVTLGNPQTVRLAWKAGVGWDFWKTSDNQLIVSSQLEWINLGNVDLDYSTSISESGLDELYDGLSNIHPNSGSGIGLGISSRWKGADALNIDPFEVGLELGVLSWWQKYQLNGINQSSVRTDTASGVGWYSGIHFDYQIDPRWSARLGSRLYSLEHELLQSTTVGLTYRFGTEPVKPQIVEVEVPAASTMDDQFILQRNASLPLNVLRNDSDLGGNLIITKVSESQTGDILISDNQKRIRYRHKDVNATTDEFDYWVSNGSEEFGPFHVIIDFVATPPTTNIDNFQVGYNTSSRLDVLANDSDVYGKSLSISEYSQPNYGSLTILDNVLIYNHEGLQDEPVTFYYWVSNGENEAGPVRVNLIILPEVFTIPVNFNPSSTIIRTEDKPALNRLSVWMFDNPDSRVSILGHTDNTGSSEANRSLSFGRAESVMNYLTTQGIDPTRLKAQGFGDTLPVSENDTVDGRLQNRRVEFRLF